MTYGIEINKPNGSSYVSSQYQVVHSRSEPTLTGSRTWEGYEMESGWYNYDVSAYADNSLDGLMFVQVPVGGYLLRMANTLFTQTPTITPKTFQLAGDVTPETYDCVVYDQSGNQTFVASQKVLSITESVVVTANGLTTTLINSTSDWACALSGPLQYYNIPPSPPGRTTPSGLRRNSTTQWEWFEARVVGAGPPVDWQMKLGSKLSYLFSREV